MSYEVEKDWQTKAGFRAVVLMGDLGHRCGYVGVPSGHPLFGVEYSQTTEALAELPPDEPIGKRGIVPIFCASMAGNGIPRTPEMTFDVHGGITYSGGKDDYPLPSDLWWFGYDCGHAGDKPAPNSRMGHYYRDDHESIHRSLDYCVAECESLAQQIIDRVFIECGP